MTFRKRHWFLRRLALSLAFAAATASPAAAMHVPGDAGGSAAAPSGAGSVWTDLAYALGGAAVFAGAAGSVAVALRSRDSRLARA